VSPNLEHKKDISKRVSETQFNKLHFKTNKINLQYVMVP